MTMPSATGSSTWQGSTPWPQLLPWTLETEDRSGAEPEEAQAAEPAFALWCRQADAQKPRPWASRVWSAPSPLAGDRADPRSFAALLEQPPCPGQERNARTVRRFNRGDHVAVEVLKLTSVIMRKCDHWDDALACLHALSRCQRRNPLTGREEVVCPDHFSYGIAMGICQKAGRADKVQALLQHLRDCGPLLPDPVSIQPDVELFSIAIAELEADGLVDHALALFGLLLEQAPPASPQSTTYHAAIAVCKKAERVEPLLWLFEHLRTHGPSYRPAAFPRTNTYNMVISACTRQKRHTQALDFFWQLLREGPGLPVPAYANAVSYAVGLAACEQSGQPDLYAEILAHGIRGLPGLPASRVFRPSLGFDAARNELDLHECAVALLPDGAPAAVVRTSVARAIIHCLRHEPEQLGHARGIDRQTVFRVGPHRSNLLTKTVHAFMRAEGWNPKWKIEAHTGVLCDAATAMRRRTQGRSELNPLARPWTGAAPPAPAPEHRRG
ncbi:hypothetical protein GT347_17985 [Xylophilus rhododendri]|uniref:Uncharacterized protein n=1 Tax=Xylophilus rhododendri TaxID=2697032 RepID=A0A857J6R4_9BURK|nr:hypothetical protein [Xylophilus rhododendri]QHI99700.1 hypothetical protein GT347_17985 [Xylophilus rhododendri]